MDSWGTANGLFQQNNDAKYTHKIQFTVSSAAVRLPDSLLHILPFH